MAVTIKPAREYDPDEILVVYARCRSKTGVAEFFDVTPSSHRFSRAFDKCVKREWIVPESPVSQNYRLTSRGVDRLRERGVEVDVRSDYIVIE